MVAADPSLMDRYLTKDEIDGLELKPVTARKLRAAIVTAAHYAG